MVERLPILHHSADYISLPLRSLGPLYTLEGVCSVANLTTAYEDSEKRDSHFLSVMCSLFPKAIFETFIYILFDLGITISLHYQFLGILQFIIEHLPILS